MLVQSVCRVPPTRLLPIETQRRPQCPRCGNVLFIAEASRFNGAGRIDHAWLCDDCGKEFVTSVRFLVALDMS